VKEPPQLVFQRYTEAEHLSAGGSTPPRAVIDKLDLRAGRRYRFVLHAPDGQQFAVRVAYLEIDCPHRLVKSFVYEGKPEDEAIDTNAHRAGGRGNPGPAARGSTRRSPRATRFESGGAPGLRASGRARGIATERSIPREQAVLLWSVLENAGAPVTVRGFGMLFDDRQPDGNKTEER
jgi:uncharacterized protein YndB with AHSA1/START domain